MTRRTIQAVLFLIASILVARSFLPSVQDGISGYDTFSCDDAQYPIECEALVAFYNETYGYIYWRNNNSWLETLDVCVWYGITCDNNGQVSEIEIMNDQLIGDLPAEIGNLSKLKKLNFRNNVLKNLPAEIGNLSNLQSLSMWNNSLTSLPAEIGNLSNLQSLDMRGNGLTSLPAEIGNLSNLRNLNLWNNKLTNLPPEIGNLSNLRTLDVKINPLTCIPEGVAHLVEGLPVCEE